MSSSKQPQVDVDEVKLQTETSEVQLTSEDEVDDGDEPVVENVQKIFITDPTALVTILSSH